MKKKYNYLDLFSGVGGFALGAYWAGMKFENHFCSDIEKYPVELYQKRFPDSIQLGDITKIDWHKLKKDNPGEWILTGGFSCQDLSVAGKGRGLIDKETGEKTRSGLWFDYWKGVSILQPRFVIIENVRALLNRGLSTVLSNLAEIGYNAEWQIISAENMGAPHKRERVWIIAYPDGIRGGEVKGNFGNGESREISHDIRPVSSRGKNGDIQMAYPKSRESGEQTKRKRRENLGRGSKEMANPQGEGRERRQAGEQGKQAQLKKEIPGRSNTGIKSNYWTVEPSICGMVDGVPGELYGYEGRLTNKSNKRVDRLKGLGNSIVPQIAELLFNQIKDYL